MSTYILDRADVTYRPTVAQPKYRTLHVEGSQQKAVTRALGELNMAALEGQILIHTPLHEIIGYAIKQRGEPAYFEASE